MAKGGTMQKTFSAPLRDHGDATVPLSAVSPGPWVVRLYGEYGQYEGHAWICADPKGLARSVCEGFVDDMVFIAAARNAEMTGPRIPLSWRLKSQVKRLWWKARR